MVAFKTLVFLASLSEELPKRGISVNKMFSSTS